LYLFECRNIKSSIKNVKGRKKTNSSKKSDKTNKISMKITQDDTIYNLEQKVQFLQNKISDLNNIIDKKSLNIISLQKNYKKQVEILKEYFGFKGDVNILISGHEFSDEYRCAKEIKDAIDNVKIYKAKIKDLEDKLKKANDEINRHNNNEEINNFRELNKNDKDFGKNVKNFTKNLYKKYVNEFLDNDLIDEENKKEFVEKLKKNLNNKLDKFDKENEKIFKDTFESSLNDLSNNFIQDLSKKSDNNKYFDFFFEFDNFIQKANQLCPDFPQKNDIIYDKVVEILRKYVEENINLKNKKREEEFKILKNENEKQKIILKDLIINSDKNDNDKKDEENEIRNNINEIKLRIRKTEKIIDDVKNNKNKEEEENKKDIINIKNKYESQIREIINNQKEKNSEIILKKEQLKIMKKNYDKLMELHQKKIDYYETEVKKLREKYDILLKQSENSEIKSNNSNRINASNKENISKNKNKDIISNDLNEFMGYIQDNLIKQNEENKLMMSKIIKDKEKDCANEKELYNNFRNIKQTNEDLNIKIGFISVFVLSFSFMKDSNNLRS
jgi:hypothetical protein